MPLVRDPGEKGMEIGIEGAGEDPLKELRRSPTPSRIPVMKFR